MRAPDLFSSLAVLAAFVVVVIPATASAQTTPDVAASQIARAQGKNVHVTDSQGDRRTGRLVSATAAGVVLHERGQDVTVALVNVRRVERVSHAMRHGLLIGAVAGFIYGYGVTEEDAFGSAGEIGGGALIAGIGAAGGLGIGALVRGLGHRVVYEAGARPSAGIAPVLSPTGRAGLALLVRW
jgi:hypothetical protein